MGRVLTNAIALQYAEESSLGVAGSDWRELEPNSIGSLGATITTVAREPISQSRQRQRGTITDLDSAIEFEHDLTLSAFRDFMQGFLFSNTVNRDVTNIPVTAVASGGYTVAAKTGRPALKAGHLIWASGFDASANNGLHELGGALAASGTNVPVSGRTAAAGDAGLVSLAGLRIDSPTWAYASGSKQGTLTKASAFANSLLSVGQVVHIGSPSGNGMGGNSGYGRVVSVSNNAIVLDKLSSELQKSITVGTNDVDVLYGEFIRNVPTTNSAYDEKSYTFEATYPNLQVGSDTDGPGYEYAKGNYCNTLGITLPLTNKATMAFAFVGTDTDAPTATRVSGAANATAPSHVAAYNTTADVARLRVAELDEDGLTTDFKNVTIALNNNVTGEKVLGRLGAKFVNAGNFEVNIEAQLLFTDAAVPAAVRNNTPVSMDFYLSNDDGVIAFDIPSATLGGGDREFPTGESVLANLNGQAYEDATLGTSIGVSIIPVPLS